MSKNGILRDIDQLGRLVIPKQFRREMDIPDEGGTVTVTCQNGVVTVQKAVETCVFCRSKRGLIEFKDKLICPKCLAELKGEEAE